jgi:ketosteroid isomerase-like protein
MAQTREHWSERELPRPRHVGTERPADPADGRLAIERLYIRFPALARFLIRVIVALPRSSLRRAILRYGYARGYASSTRRDWDYQRTYVHPDVEVDISGASDWGLDPDRDYRGFDGYVASITPILDAWAPATFEIRDVVDVASDSIVVVFRMHARGVGRGIRLSSDFAHTISYRDGWVVRMGFFSDAAEALASAGLAD